MKKPAKTLQRALSFTALDDRELALIVSAQQEIDIPETFWRAKRKGKPLQYV